MKIIDVLEIITSNAKEYYNDGVIESLKRNQHMNNYEGEDVNDETIKAILVDFINFIGMKQGVDYAMYTRDLVLNSEKAQ